MMEFRFKRYLGQYLVKNPFLFFYLKSVDICFSFLFFFKKKLQKNKKYHRILISNIAHMGDCVIATSVLPAIKNKYPHCDIGFLTGSWNKEVIIDHPMVKWVHFVNHPLLDRGQSKILKKIYRFLLNFVRVIQEIKKIKYDAAVDLRPFYPNSIFLLFFTKIPQRIGFSSAGFSAFLTDIYHWKHLKKHISYSYLDLLTSLEIYDLSKLKSYLPHLQNYNNGNPKTPQDSFVVFHLFSGDSKKDWDMDKWKKLSHKFLDLGFLIVMTGKGTDQRLKIEKEFNFSDKIINLCDNLNIKGLSEVILHSKLVVSVDTLTGHLAAAFNKPIISIHPDMTNAYLWKPNSDYSLVLDLKPFT